MKLDVFNIQGEKTGRAVDLPDDVFGGEPNEHVLYLSVKQYLANQRQGTHKSKERWEISGSTRKLHRQKGTGGSRKGDINSPLFPGGARVFGPRPRDYEQKLNKKVKRLARRSALSTKAQSGSIVIVEDFNFETAKTKNFADILSKLNVSGKKSLVVVAEQNDNVFRSSRNIPTTKVVRAQDLNTYEILRANALVLSEGSIQKIVETLA
ncbi:50S ribosomal protein L4 [Haliscomenobacter hydrossis]|uniref:Large ribosomal subunit protein uL4 n=1 Tax=Haliscomenobacter hydrossis (strain ATCC 27775 / DSM 1100 / LMG 10767 / O) TaxID=760192 RepID=F4KWU4_HALH1|nr:50S ribosomal protein L4 [Haliscomenobacter hydrossis]AEE52577.1 ribosomal protein L4/L1e [Haliscomenobacter hydrossis DSM 1100]